jgi:hypothetical protein
MPSAPADQQARDAAAGRVAGPPGENQAAWETGHGEMAPIDWQTSVRNSSRTCHSI